MPIWTMTHRHRPPSTKWRRSQPRLSPTSVVNKLIQKSTENLVRVLLFHPNSHQQGPYCSSLGSPWGCCIVHTQTHTPKKLTWQNRPPFPPKTTTHTRMHAHACTHTQTFNYRKTERKISDPSKCLFFWVGSKYQGSSSSRQPKSKRANLCRKNVVCLFFFRITAIPLMTLFLQVKKAALSPSPDHYVMDSFLTSSAGVPLLSTATLMPLGSAGVAYWVLG